jgi:ketosteroid isomerase-like protein
MSQENVELVRRLSEATDAHGWKAALDLVEQQCDDDFEWIEDPSWPGGETCRGVAAVRALLADRTETLDVDVQTEKLIDAGDEVVAFSCWRGRGHASGVQTELHVATVTTVRAGRIARVRFYLDRHEALKAVGLER